MLAAIDPYMPKFDIRERFERRVNAPPSTVMKTAYEFDMQSIWLIWLIVNARKLILGGSFEKRHQIGMVEETRQLGWGTLGEDSNKLICGAVCQPWFGDVKFTPIPAEKYLDYSEPDLVKIAWTLEVSEIEPNVTLFIHEVRAIATDDAARKKFLRYWRWARFGIIAIRLLLLPAVRREAERDWRQRSS